MYIPVVDWWSLVLVQHILLEYLSERNDPCWGYAWSCKPPRGLITSKPLADIFKCQQLSVDPSCLLEKKIHWPLAHHFGIHPGRLTWNLQITHIERKMIFQASMIMFHVNLPECIHFEFLWVDPPWCHHMFPTNDRMPSWIHSRIACLNVELYYSEVTKTTGWWFQIFVVFTIWSMWLISFNWVESTNHKSKKNKTVKLIEKAKVVEWENNYTPGN